jgi:uncharacterized protein
MPNIDHHEPGTPMWVDVIVSSDDGAEQLREFYTALYGWTWDVDTPESGSYSLARSDGRLVLGLTAHPEGNGLLIPYFASTDIHEETRRAQALGATVTMEPMVIFEHGSMVAMSDPTGATFGFWQPNQFHGFGVVHEPSAPGWYDHQSRDPNAAAQFYSALLGQPIQTPGPGMLVLGADGNWFASFSPDSADGPTKWNPIYIVDSLAHARDTIKKNGGTIVLEEMDVPGSKISVFTEPVMHTTVTVMQHGASN